MAKIEKQELENDILNILNSASTGKGFEHGYLTSYQILIRLPQYLQQKLKDMHGDFAGRGAGEHFSPVTRVAQVASQMNSVEQGYLDTKGLSFDVGQDEEVSAGFNLCAIFRLKGSNTNL